MSTPPDSADRDATRYGPTPPADPAATRYSDTPAATDAAATRYSDTPSAETAVAPGRLPRRFGGYELLEEIGHGGMGVVYKARQFSPERLVALKLIRAGQLADEEDIRRFRQEANEAARLDHPNIVPVYEVGEHDGLHFFTMRLVEGGSLNQHLDRYRNDCKAAARLLATAARAVHYAHQRQLLHRDLKPGNILLDAAGPPYVADFGLAKRLGEGGEASQSQEAGTPEYMAPEQARGEKRLTTAADVYGLGGVLYALLAGRPPFRGSSPLATMQKVLTDEPAPPSKVRPGVPRDLETICLKCLAREPGRRYGSAEALAEDLERWMKGEPVHGRPVRRLERAWLWCKRSPAAAGLLTAFVTALLLGVGVSSYFAVTSNSNYQDARQREKDANDALAEVTNRDRKISADKADLQDTLARSLLQPLGQGGKSMLTDPEIDSLWLLAKSEDEMRFLFMEHALQRPSTAGQLRDRADFAIHAVVGLNPARRRKVEELLLARLGDGRSDLDHRCSCVLIGVALEDWTPEFAGAAARQAMDAVGTAKYSSPSVLATLAPRLGPAEASADARRALDAMAKTTDSSTLSELAWAWRALAPRLEAAEAARQASAVVHQIAAAMARTNNPTEVSTLANALAALAPRLGPAEASAEFHQIVDATATTRDLGALYCLKAALVALAPRLGPAETSAAVRQLVDATAKTKDPVVLGRLAEALAALASQLEPAEAARQASAVARQVADAMAKTNDQAGVEALEVALAALAPRLGPAEAPAAARQIVDAMANPHIIGPTPRALADALALLAPRLEPAEASTVAHQALTVMASMRGPTSRPLVDVVAALAPRLGPAEASAAARQTLDALDAWAKTENVSVMGDLAEALATLAPRLEPAEASAAARQALTVISKSRFSAAILGGMGLPKQRGALEALGPWLKPAEALAAARQTVDAMAQTNLISPGMARALVALTARLEPAEADRLAAAAARRIVEAMAMPNEPSILRSLPDALVALAPRLGPAEASAEFRQVLDAMIKTTNPNCAASLGKAVEILAPRLGPADALPAARQVVDAMSRTEPFNLPALAGAFAALAPQLEPAEASADARQALDAMTRMHSWDVVTTPPLAQALSALMARVEPAQASERMRSLAWVVSDGGVPPSMFATLGPLTEASRPLPGRFPEQQLVDLLKIPTCGRDVRQAILRQLGWQCGRTFATSWDFVDSAQKNRPDLDLTSPPVRPDAP